MSAGIETELAESQLPDRRHAKRLAHLRERFSEQSVRSIPRACQGWAETMAAYRLLDHPRVGRKEILCGPPHAPLARLQAHEAVLVVQAPTFLHSGTLRPKKGGGTGQERRREEYL
jgi:transposase-like protein